MSIQNIFLYINTKEYELISILRNIIYLHSTNGNGYKVNLITDNNINDYFTIPNNFNKLCPTHKAEVVKVNVICDRGGIWLDNSTLVLDSLDSLFDSINTKDGFFIKHDAQIYTTVFGSKKNTPLMLEWKTQLMRIFENEDVYCCEIGNILEKIKRNNPSLYDNYTIYNGFDNLFPINKDDVLTEFINKPYDNYNTIVREYQPLIILTNAIYKIEHLSGDTPLLYFINKSFQTMKLKDYDFIEIGTSDFDTLIQTCDEDAVGISVDPIQYYINKLPEKKNVKKYVLGISNVNTKMHACYIPEDVIEKHKLPVWFKGCNCINTYHPLHIQHNVAHLCKIEEVDVITAYELFYQNNVRNVKYLKIDTERHDCVILKSLHSYIKYLPTIFYPKKILFESNEHTIPKDIDEVIILFISIGYRIESRGYDTVLVYP